MVGEVEGVALPALDGQSCRLADGVEIARSGVKLVLCAPSPPSGLFIYGGRTSVAGLKWPARQWLDEVWDDTLPARLLDCAVEVRHGRWHCYLGTDLDALLREVRRYQPPPLVALEWMVELVFKGEAPRPRHEFENLVAEARRVCLEGEPLGD